MDVKVIQDYPTVTKSVVKDLKTGRIEITSQNHGFVVDLESLSQDEVEKTHINLNDGTLEGIRHKKKPLFSVQYHPENSPGPHDSDYLFDRFVSLMEKNAAGRQETGSASKEEAGTTS